MLLVDQILMVASVLQDGDAGSYHQMVASKQLQKIAPAIQRMEEQLDTIVGDAQDEDALAAPVPLRRHLRLVPRL
jgi:hypothetical protein